MQRLHLLKSSRRRAGGVRDAILQLLLTRRAKRRLKRPGAGRLHGLPSQLIVSLTSYPARFNTLHLTLACLLDQTVKADRTILWIAKQDRQALPPAVLAFEDRGLEIRVCDDLRSYKKLIPALQAFPEASIATADDDIFYPRNWLEILVEAVEEGVIPCHRAHRIRRNADGTFRPYVDWENDVQDAKARQASSEILATSGAGALYSRRSFDPRVTDRSLFERLCPDGDDLWFYWCARMRGALHKKVGGKMRLMMWTGSQETSLWKHNEAGGNDRMIAALQAELGGPEAHHLP
jgi:hypothetical protein